MLQFSSICCSHGETFSGATSLSSVSKYKLTNSTPFSIRVLISLQVIPNLRCLHSNELPSRMNSFLLDVGICIHGKEKKDLLAKLAYNPHMQLRRTKDCMYLCHRAESGVLNAHCTHSWHSPFSLFTPGFKHTENDQVLLSSSLPHWWSLTILGTPSIFHILLHWTPFDHIHKTAKTTGAEEWIHSKTFKSREKGILKRLITFRLVMIMLQNLHGHFHGFQNCEDGYLAIKVLPPHQAIYQQHILHHQYNCSTL